MTVTNGYCTAAQLREHLGDDTSITNTNVLERAINATSRAIDRYCGRRFWQDSVVQTRYYRPTETDLAWVHDISTTTGLVIATDTSLDGTFATTWATTDYELEPLDADGDGAGYAWWRIAAVDRYSFLVGARRKHLAVTAKFGWSAVPDDVTEACILRAAGLFKRKDAPFGVAGFSEFGAVRITRQDPDVIALLHPFVRMTMAAVGAD